MANWLRRPTTLGDVIPFPRQHEPWMTEMQLANHFGVTTRTIRNWRAQGMPSQKFGGIRRYRLSDVMAWHEEASREHPVA